MQGNQIRSEIEWPVIIGRVINASACVVWDDISSPGILEKCHPFCAQNPVKVWSGADSRDEIHYLNGLIYERRFYQWQEGSGYDLEILQNGRVLAIVMWRVSEIGDQSCKLQISIYPRFPRKYPVFINWLVYRFRLRPMLGKYLKSVIRGFEWYATSRTPVTQNQFGKHPWFSAPEKVHG